MKRAVMVMGGGLLLLVVGTGGLSIEGSVRKQGGQAIDALSRPTVARATVDQFAWEAGKWVGMDGKTMTEQTCEPPANHVMACISRVTDEKKTVSFQFYTLREIPAQAGSTETTLEERLRVFSPDMTEVPTNDGLTLKLVSITATSAEYESAKPSVVLRGKVSWKEKDEYNVVIQYTGADGKPVVSDTTMKRVK